MQNRMGQEREELRTEPQDPPKFRGRELSRNQQRRQTECPAKQDVLEGRRADRLRRVRATRFISAKGGPPGGANRRRRPGWGGRKKLSRGGRQAAGSFAGEPLWEQGLPF